MHPLDVTLNALAAITLLLTAYLGGLAYIAYVDEELSYQLINFLFRVMGV